MKAALRQFTGINQRGQHNLAFVHQPAADVAYRFQPRFTDGGGIVGEGRRDVYQRRLHGIQVIQRHEFRYVSRQHCLPLLWG